MQSVWLLMLLTPAVVGPQGAMTLDVSRPGERVSIAVDAGLPPMTLAGCDAAAAALPAAERDRALCAVPPWLAAGRDR